METIFSTQAELVRKNFFGEGGLDSQQWGIVSIQRVQMLTRTSPNEALARTSYWSWLGEESSQSLDLRSCFACGRWGQGFRRGRSGTNPFAKLIASRSSSCCGSEGTSNSTSSFCCMATWPQSLGAPGQAKNTRTIDSSRASWIGERRARKVWHA